MGYYTRHGLAVDEGEVETHAEAIEEISGYSELFRGEEVKWYDHEEDMRTYSEKFPDTLFTLKGEGEESGDLWVEYYRDGLMQRCKAAITYADFSANLLS